MTDPTLLVLASLADGDKHGYAMMEDIEQFASVRLGPGNAVRRHHAPGGARLDPPHGVARPPATVHHHRRRAGNTWKNRWPAWITC